MRVYFDMCAIQRPLDDQAHLRVRLEAEAMLTLIQLCEMGPLELVISAAHEIENAQNPYVGRRHMLPTFSRWLGTACGAGPMSLSERPRTSRPA